MKKLQVSEIFWSIQGEGVNAGKPAMFIRLFGCNQKCSFCDTKYSWKPSSKGFVSLDPYHIIKEIEKLCPRTGLNVCITGGEPLIQDIEPLVNELYRKGHIVWLESNATIYKEVVEFIDWVAVSPKQDLVLRKMVRASDEIKIVVADQEGIDFAYFYAYDFPDKTIWCQPQDNDVATSIMIVAELKKRPLPNIRCGFQIHKTLWGNRKGV